MIGQDPVKLRLCDRDATQRLGHVMASVVAPRMVVALTGPMGAGKTTLVQSLAVSLGVTEYVTSPTFTMINEYHSGRLPLYHLDLYRLSEDAANLVEMLLTELDEIIASQCVVVIEWAELLKLTKAGENFFDQLDHLVVKLEYVEEVKPSKDEKQNSPSFYIESARTAELTGHGAESAQQLKHLKSQIQEFINNP
jgi:tRNA threonylcarbamoyladenosine biosynthesis protein TsaE